MTTTTTTTMTDRRPWDLVIDAGIAAFVVGAIFTQVVLAGAVIPPLVILPVLLIAAAVVRRSRHRAGVIAAGVLGLLAIVGNAPFVIDDLSHAADAPLQFAMSLLMLAGTVAVIVGAVASFRETSGERARLFLAAAAAVVVVGAVVAGALTLTAESDDALAGDVSVQTKDIEFEPETVTVASGGGLFVENDDLVRHTFTVEDQDIDLGIPAGQSRRVDIDLPAGTYDFFCDVPGHEDMEGTLVVE